MSGAFLTWAGNGQLLFDITVSEQHEGTLDITEFPVETGPDVADHAREALQKLTLVCFVSNSPLEDLGRGMVRQPVTLDAPNYQPPFAPTPGAFIRTGSDAIRNAFGGSTQALQVNVLKAVSAFNSVRDTEAALRQLQRDRMLVAVTTSVRSYESMLLESWEMPRDADSGDGAEVTMHFRQLRVVESVLVNAPKPAEPRGQKPVVKGVKAPVKAPPAQSVALKAALALIPGSVPGAGAIP